MLHIYENSETRYFGPVGAGAPRWVDIWLKSRPWYAEFFEAYMAAYNTADPRYRIEECVRAIQRYLDEHHITEIKIINGQAWADIEITTELTMLILSS